MTGKYPVLLIRSERISRWDSSVQHTINLLGDTVPEENRYSFDYREFDTEAERKAYGLALETEPNQEDIAVFHDENDIRTLDKALGLGLFKADAMSKKSLIESSLALAELLQNQKDTVDTQARNGIADILRAIPSHEILSDDALGYINYETIGGEYVETTIHGVRIDDNGSITVTAELDYDDEDNSVIEDWDDPDRDMTFSEDDHYSTIDWVMTFRCVSDYVKGHPELLAEQ